MKTLLPVMALLIVLCTGCSVFNDLAAVAEKSRATLTAVQEGTEKARELVNTVHAYTTTAKNKLEAARREADTNQDGITTSDEWWAWLIGGGGLLAGVLKLLNRNVKSDERKAKMEARLDHLDKRLNAKTS